jgi:hypothetical protein
MLINMLYPDPTFTSMVLHIHNTQLPKAHRHSTTPLHHPRIMRQHNKVTLVQ